MADEEDCFESEGPHVLEVLMPPSEFRASEYRFTLRVDCQVDTLEDIADRVRPRVFVPPSHKALWVSPATGKPHLDMSLAIVNQGIRDGDTLKLFFFTETYQGFEKLRSGEFVEPTTDDVV